MKQRRPDDVIRCSADADPMSKTIIGPMKLSVIGPMKHPSRARHRADEVVLVGLVGMHQYTYYSIAGTAYSTEVYTGLTMAISHGRLDYTYCTNIYTLR